MVTKKNEVGPIEDIQKEINNNFKEFSDLNGVNGMDILNDHNQNSYFSTPKGNSIH